MHRNYSAKKKKGTQTLPANNINVRATNYRRRPWRNCPGLPRYGTLDVGW